MNDSKISVRYAKALFDSANEQGVLDTVRKDMLHLQELCKMEEFEYFLRLPIIKESQKRKVMKTILEDKAHSLTLALLDLVLNNKRELYIPGIARNFEDQYKRDKGIKSAVLVSAATLDNKVKDQISAILKKALDSQIELKTEKNRDLIGGFVINIDNQQYDASVARKLKNIEKQLLN
jgi:F-type H+-transporting ATPase subunit delta